MKKQERESVRGEDEYNEWKQHQKYEPEGRSGLKSGSAVFVAVHLKLTEAARGPI
jgi:hypothetical protein